METRGQTVLEETMEVLKLQANNHKRAQEEVKE